MITSGNENEIILVVANLPPLMQAVPAYHVSPVPVYNYSAGGNAQYGYPPVVTAHDHVMPPGPPPAYQPSPTHGQTYIAPVAVATVETNDQPRTAQCIIQGNPAPGSHMTVQAPNGCLITLVVPNDVKDGAVITYSY